MSYITDERNLKKLALAYASKELSKRDFETVCRELFDDADDFVWMDGVCLSDFVEYVFKKEPQLNPDLYAVYLNVSVLGVVLVKKENKERMKFHYYHPDMIRIK